MDIMGEERVGAPTVVIFLPLGPSTVTIEGGQAWLELPILTSSKEGKTF